MKKMVLTSAVLLAVGCLGAMDKKGLEKPEPVSTEKIVVDKAVKVVLRDCRNQFFRKRFLRELGGVRGLSFDKGGNVSTAGYPISDIEFAQLNERSKKLDEEVDKQENGLRGFLGDVCEKLKLEMALESARIERAKVSLERDIEAMLRRDKALESFDEADKISLISISMKYLKCAILIQFDLETKIEELNQKVKQERSLLLTKRFFSVIKKICNLECDFVIKVAPYSISDIEFAQLEERSKKLDEEVEKQENGLKGFSGDRCEKLKLEKTLVASQIERMKVIIERVIEEAFCLKDSDENSKNFLVNVRMDCLLRNLENLIAKQISLEAEIENAKKESK